MSSGNEETVTLTDSSKGLVALKGERYGSVNTLFVDSVTEISDAVVINSVRIDHVYIGTDCIILEMQDGERFFFRVERAY